MSNTCVPCFTRILFTLIPSYIELPRKNLNKFSWLDLSEADSDPLPTSKFELFVAIVHGFQYLY